MDDSNYFSLFMNLFGTIPGILWPIILMLALFVLTRFKPAIAKKLKERASSKSMSGFHSEVRLLEEAITLARRELGDAKQIDTDNLEALASADPDAGKILQRARQDPELGIILLTGLLDKETRILAGSSGEMDHRRILQGQGPLKSLVEKRHLPEQIVRPIEAFTSLSNRIVRQKIARTDPDVLRVLAMGMILLNTMRSMKEVSYRVYKVGVDLFSDEHCKNMIPDLKGVIIEKVGPEGSRVDTRILPSSNPGYYHEGKRVSLEWNVERLWQTSYYIDPDTSEKRLAWDSSAEFSGRHLDSL